MNEQINSYVKEGLSKGYTEEQLKQILIDYKAPPQDIADAFDFVNSMMAKDDSSQKSHGRLYSWLLILGGILIMIAVYIFKIFRNLNAESTEELSAAMMLAKGLWPFVFPIGANAINFAMFRRRFLFGLILTFGIILAMVGFIYLMDKIAAA